jgi:hypothetical protein
MIEIGTDFPYLGTRNYIHATSILSGFLDALETRATREIVVKRLKFQRPAQSNGRLLLTPEAIPGDALAAANCTFLATVDGAPWRGVFSERATTPARRETVSYDVGDIEARGFGGTCRIAAASRSDLIRVLVEANKRFHETALAAEAPLAVRFGYLENWVAPPANAAFTGRLEAANLIARKTDDSTLTVNRLTYSDGAEATTLTLCFNVTHGAPS